MNGDSTDLAQVSEVPGIGGELQGAWEAVAEHLKRIDENPDGARAWEICGQALRSEASKCREDINRELLNREALARFEKALSIHPDSPRSLSGKARCLMDAIGSSDRLAELLEAESCLTKLCGFSEATAWDWHTLARCGELLASLATDPDEERRWRQRSCGAGAEAVRLAGDDHWVILSAGIHLRWLGDCIQPESRTEIYLQAVDHFSRASALKPDGTLELSHWAGTLLSLAEIAGDRDQKIGYLRAATARARQLIERGDADDYLSLLAQCLEDSADELQGPEKVELYEEALVWQERALILDPSEPWNHHFCARLLFKLSEETEEMQRAGLLRRALSYHASADVLGEDSYDLYRWAIALENLSEEEEGESVDRCLEQARSHASRASQLEPGNADYLKKWGRLLSLIADRKGSCPSQQNELRIDALEKLSHALRLCPSDDIAWLYQGQVLSDLGDRAEDDDSVLARSYYERSVESFGRAAELDPGWDSPWGWKGNVLADIARISEDREEIVRLLMESDRCIATAVALDPGYHTHFRLWALTLRGLAREETSPERKRELCDAIREKWTRFLELVPGAGDALEGIADALIEKSELSEGAEKLSLLNEALRYCELALESTDNRSNVLLAWANALRDKAMVVKDRDEKIAILRQSADLCRQAAEEDPEEWIVPLNLGHTLHYLSLQMTATGERMDVLQHSTTSYVSAWQLNPEISRTASLAADGYEGLANLSDDRPRKVRLLESALQYRRIASGNDQLKPEFLSDWGITLSILAEVVDKPEAAARLLDQAEAKFRAALKLNPEESDSWLGWGRVLLDRADDGYELGGRTRLLVKARRKFEKAIACGEGEAFFELARTDARQRDVEAAISALSRWRDLVASASAKTIQDCSDFDDLSSNAAFQAFLASWKS